VDEFPAGECIVKQWFIIAVKAAFTVGLVWWLLGQIEWDSVLARLRGLDVMRLGLAYVAVLAAYSLLTLRWRAVNTGISIEFPLGRTLQVTWIGAFFSQTLPSTMGGDAVRIWYLYRSGETLVRATSSLILDRICGLSGLMLIVLFSLPLVFEFVSSAPARWGLAILMGVVAAVVATLVITGRFQNSFLDRWAVTRPLIAVARDANALFKNPAAAGVAIVAGVSIQLLIILAAWLIGQSMGGVVTFPQSLALIPPVVLAATLPVSIAGWGLREGAMVVALGYVGVSASDAITLSVMLGLLLTAAGLPGGVVWLLSGREKPAPPEEISRKSFKDTI
jgi:glycosyltransferase 2 family protein